MIVGRGVAGFGAGGEYPVCGTNATESSDETVQLRKNRGFLVAVTTDFAIDLVGFFFLPRFFTKKAFSLEILFLVSTD